MAESLHELLLAATGDRFDNWHVAATRRGAALRAVVELHAPKPYWEHKPDEWLICPGCDMSGYDAENPPWPCSTIRTIAEALGVSVEGDH